MTDKIRPTVRVQDEHRGSYDDLIKHAQSIDGRPALIIMICADGRLAVLAAEHPYLVQCSLEAIMAFAVRTLGCERALDIATGAATGRQAGA